MGIIVRKCGSDGNGHNGDVAVVISSNIGLDHKISLEPI